MASSDFVENIIQTLRGFCVNYNNSSAIDAVEQHKIVNAEEDNIDTAVRLSRLPCFGNVFLSAINDGVHEGEVACFPFAADGGADSEIGEYEE